MLQFASQASNIADVSRVVSRSQSNHENATAHKY